MPLDVMDATNAMDAIYAMDVMDAMDAMDAIDAMDAMNAMDAMDAMDAMKTIDAMDAMDEDALIWPSVKAPFLVSWTQHRSVVWRTHEITFCCFSFFFVNVWLASETNDLSAPDLGPLLLFLPLSSSSSLLLPHSPHPIRQTSPPTYICSF